MDFSTAVSTCFNKYVDFEGRARRSEYWYFALFTLIAFVILLIAGLGMGYLLGGERETLVISIIVPLGLFWLAILLPHLAVQVRRFHDLGVTGWFVLIFIVLGIIPYLGTLSSIAELIWFCQRGTDGENKYGQDPYGYDPSEVFS